MKHFKIIILVIGLSLFLTLNVMAVEIMKVTDIKPGMEGEGRTIFKGSKIESFPFKVLGVVSNFAPGRKMIIIEIDNPILKEAGIIAGMSGSPAYIDGKLIGAVAFGFNFAKRPIGGITPIQDMLDIAEYNKKKSKPAIDINSLKIKFDKKNTALVARFLQKELKQRVNFSPVNNLSPIKLMGLHSGFKPEALNYLSPVFTPISSLQGSGQHKAGQHKAGQKIKGLENSADMLNLRPADAVAVPLIKGDFEFSSIGTVTHVDGDNVYIFGHPLYNMGAVELPLHRAEVITVVPSVQSSFKLGATREMVGMIQQDRFAACYGKLGKVPYMIPMNVFLKNRNRKFKIEMINHPLITPALGAISIANIFSTEYQQFGYQSLQIKGKIFIEGEKNIVINDLYTGQDAFGDFTNLLLAVNFFLMNNREKTIKIQKLDFEISGSEEVRRANIENILINKKSFLPGEVMDVDIYLRNEKGKEFIESLNIKAPNIKAGSPFYLLVADNAAMGNFDSKNVKSSYFPIKLNPLIRAINNLRKNNRLYIKLMTPTKGLYVKGREYSNLPSSLQNLFEYNKTPVYGATSGTQSRIKLSTVMEYQVELQAVVKGQKLFKLKIKERSDAH